MNRIETSDSYHASYLVINGVELAGVECVSIANEVSCKLIFSGPSVLELTEQFFNNAACVNLYAFRIAYRHVQRTIQQEVQHYKAKLKRSKETEQTAGGVQ